ncbi:hypothetical protein [Stenotrophomonas sp. 278]|uniref:hypothetical protein n=1 Tax=Stenotrophomonas sp. 278 TaxID=2479851 RepID=UPI000F676464|nr:hypothetical protein [Stenotrophomonas sp. 278]RRU05926.1 hypothetical protein EGJ34_17685 [Stenotrophomonas sp. 278]
MTENMDLTDTRTDSDPLDALYDRAYAAFNGGELQLASTLFAELIEASPPGNHLHYMRGLTHKYLLDWRTSLEHNLQAQQLEDEFNEASAWNAGIAATALGNWSEARRQWARCGINIPEGEGPIERDFGLISVRLNPWGKGETVFARRIDVVRARLLNVPLPESGHRLFDIVLHDGAPTGERRSGKGTVPVFNALQTLQASDHRTYTAFVRSPSAEAMSELLDMELPGVGYVEDWTASVVTLCLRCSYGVPHVGAAANTAHEVGAASNDDWRIERNLGIGAQGKAAVERLLANWVAAGPDRYIDGIETREQPNPVPEDGHVWWEAPTDSRADG